MKTFKKFAALLVAALLVLAMAVPAMADDPEPTPAYDHPLSVTGLTAGDEVKFFQVIEWVGEADGNVAGWKATSDFASVLTKEVLTEVLVGTKANPDAQPPVAAKDPTGITSELAGRLAKAAAGKTPAASATVQEGDTGVELDNAAGMYMGLITPADVNTLYGPVFVSADYNKEAGNEIAVSTSAKYSDSTGAKKNTLTLTKTASTTEDSWDDGKATTTAVGDTVTFTVNTTIPVYGNVYEHPHFVLKDKLTGLELVANSVTITQPSDAVATINEGTTDYTITFDESYLKGLAAATDVTVTYQAVVTKAAEKAVNEEDNEVSLEYSHDPSNQDDYELKKDTTQHYTFSIDASGIGEGESTKIKGKKTSEVVKIGLDAKGDPITETRTTSEIGDPETDYVTGPLEGAVFGLFTDAAGNTPLKDKDNNEVTATTGADGRMNFAGLDAGTYYLKEISAPAGYVTNSTVHTVVIAAETEEVTVTEWWDGSKWVDTKPATGTAKEVTYKTDILKKYTVTIDGNTAAEYTFTNNKTPNSTEIQWDEATLVEHPVALENTQGTELPTTGGMGTTILYVTGSILVLGAVVVMITRRRVRG